MTDPHTQGMAIESQDQHTTQFPTVTSQLQRVNLTDNEGRFMVDPSKVMKPGIHTFESLRSLHHKKEKQRTEREYQKACTSIDNMRKILESERVYWKELIENSRLEMRELITSRMGFVNVGKMDDTTTQLIERNTHLETEVAEQRAIVSEFKKQLLNKEMDMVDMRRLLDRQETRIRMKQDPEVFKQLDDVMRENEVLKKENAALLKDMSLATNIVEEYKKENSMSTEAKQEVSRMKQQFGEMRTFVERNKNLVEELTAELNEKDEELLAMKQLYRQAQETNHQLDLVNEDLKEDNEAIEENYKEIRKEHFELLKQHNRNKSLVGDKDDQINALKSNLIQANSEVQRMRSIATERVPVKSVPIKLESDKSEETIVALEDELKTARAELVKMESDNEERIQGIATEMDKLATLLESKDDEMEKMEKDHRIQLAKKVQVQDRLTKQMSKLKATIKKLSMRLQQVKNNNNQLQSEMETMSMTMVETADEEVQTEPVDFRADVTTEEIGVTAAVEVADKNESNVRDYVTRGVGESNELKIQGVQADFDDILEELETSEPIRRHDSNFHLINRGTALSSLAPQDLRLIHENPSLSLRLNRLEDIIDKEEENVRERTNLVKEAELELKRLDKERTLQKEEINELNKRISELIEEKQRENLVLDEIKSEKKVNEQSMNEFKIQKASLQRDIESSMVEHSRLKSAVDNIGLEAVGLLMAKKNGQIGLLDEQIKSKNSIIQELERHAEEKREMIKQRYDDRENMFSQRISELEDKKDDLESDLGIMRVEKARLKTEISVMHDDIQRMTDDLSALRRAERELVTKMESVPTMPTHDVAAPPVTFNRETQYTFVKDVKETEMQTDIVSAPPQAPDETVQASNERELIMKYMDIVKKMKLLLKDRDSKLKLLQAELNRLVPMMSTLHHRISHSDNQASHITSVVRHLKRSFDINCDETALILKEMATKNAGLSVSMEQTKDSDLMKRQERLLHRIRVLIEEKKQMTENVERLETELMMQEKRFAELKPADLDISIEEVLELKRQLHQVSNALTRSEKVRQQSVKLCRQKDIEIKRLRQFTPSTPLSMTDDITTPLTNYQPDSPMIGSGTAREPRVSTITTARKIPSTFYKRSVRL
ncbi:hypothetical protein PCE1_001856 [Barthelona sp. PCE]